MRLRISTVLLLIAVFIHAASVSGAEPVKIAAVFPKTGEALQSPMKVFMPEMLGVRLAVEELNRQGGLQGRRIQLLEYDDKSTALGGRTAGQQAIKDGCISVIGSSWSSLSLALAQVAQTAKIPMIAPDSTNPDVTLVGDYIFRVCFIDTFQGEVMASFSWKDLRARTAVVLTNTSEVYCTGLAKYFIARFKSKGGQILWEGDYIETATDFTQLLDKARQLNPDIFFVPGMTRDSGYIIKQARIMGIKKGFLGGDGWDNEMYSYGGKAIEGSFFCAHWDPQSPGAKSREFVKAFQKLHGPYIYYGSALSYDAVMLLADAVKRAKSLDPTKIRNALAATRGFKCVTGEITFDANRNPINKSAVILKFDKGKSVYVKTIKP